MNELTDGFIASLIIFTVYLYISFSILVSLRPPQTRKEKVHVYSLMALLIFCLDAYLVIIQLYSYP